MAVCSKANKVISAVILAHFTPRPRFPLASGYVSPATGLTVCNKHPPFSLRLAWLSLTNWPCSSGNNQPLFLPKTGPVPLATIRTGFLNLWTQSTTTIRPNISPACSIFLVTTSWNERSHLYAYLPTFSITTLTLSENWKTVKKAIFGDFRQPSDLSTNKHNTLVETIYPAFPSKLVLP